MERIQFLFIRQIKMTPKESYETERLILRPTSDEDAEFILELYNTPKWKANIGDRNIHSPNDALKYIQEKMQPQLDRIGFSNNTIVRKEDGAKVGTCGLYDREGLDGVDIGFALLPQYEKMGYAYEAANKVKELAISQYGIKKISAITIEANIDSRRLIEKLGLTYKGITRVPDDDEDLMLYEFHVEE